MWLEYVATTDLLSVPTHQDCPCGDRNLLLCGPKTGQNSMRNKLRKSRVEGERGRSCSFTPKSVIKQAFEEE